MKAWKIQAGAKVEGLKLVDETERPLGPHEVRIRPAAATLNFRDLMILNGWYPLAGREPLVPGSDAAGTVVETGRDVTRVKVGQRVMSTFFPHWHDGAPSARKVAGALGGGGAGVLAQTVVLGEDNLVATPAHLSDAEAACLPCAGVTAWNALFVAGALRPGQTVLLLGTGGVSVWALQLARAAGARVVITSSSDEKLARARGLGAHDLINYRQTPDWDDEVLRITDGAGVDLVLEVGGSQTVAKSIASAKVGGSVIVIGAVSGPGAAVEPMSLIAGSVRLQGVYVGSRQMHEDLARFVGVAGIRPVVDSTFGFGDLPTACNHFGAGRHFGKVAVDFAG